MLLERLVVLLLQIKVSQSTCLVVGSQDSIEIWVTLFHRNDILYELAFESATHYLRIKAL